MAVKIRNQVNFSKKRRCLRGMTLLEVLVALGILVAGLASVAALMPAAGARLADAISIDRAGTLAANAHADLKNRGILISSTIFPNNTEITGSSGRICVIGAAMGPLASGTYPITAGTLTTGSFCSPSVLPPTFSTTLQDSIELSATNSLVTDANSVSYSVTVVPTATGTISAGSPVRVGVIVFKRPDVAWMEIPLTYTGPGVFEIRASSTAEQNEANRKQFLPPCSWVFAAKGGAPAASRWLHVASSWTTQERRSFVSFSGPTADIDALTVSGTLTVQAFTHVLLADDRAAILK